MNKRKIGSKKPYKTFLIISEGITEKRYFNAFPKRGKNITIRGIGKGTKELLKKANSLCKDIERKAQITFDEKWLVFDKDNFDDFDDAIKEAEKYKFKVAYSNPCFEIWFLLHFQYIDTALDPQSICDKVCESVNNCKDCQDIKTKLDMYELLSTRQEKAKENAEKLLEKFNGTSPSKANPSTKVHLLVDSLSENDI